MQELVIEYDQQTMDHIRDQVAIKLDWLRKDYQAMLYGGAVSTDCG